MAANEGVDRPARPKGQRYVVASASDILEGDRILVDVEGREIGIFRVDGDLYALRNKCPHLGGPLCKGKIVGLIESDGPGHLTLDSSQKMLTCPWHGWEFDIKTGQSYWNPQRTRARQIPVEVTTGVCVARELETTSTERVPGPYMAEVIPVALEDDYVVVTMRTVPARDPNGASV